MRSTHRPVALGALVLGAGVMLIVAGSLAANPNHALVALVLMNVLTGAHEPLARSWFNDEVAPEERATMLSFRSAFATAGGSLGLLLGGYVVDLRGIPFHWRMAGTLALLAVPCYLALRPRRSS
jgi:MFS family permease